ncbi:MAG: DUF6528 family protein [Mucilaginibacter sp.]|uniref:DUF6528 family protein n=1 Tax=Mucilaginibacter sp. TaxID=1882438 RepID=UPI00319FD451
MKNIKKNPEPFKLSKRKKLFSTYAILKIGLALSIAVVSACTKSQSADKQSTVKAKDSKLKTLSSCVTGCWIGVTNNANSEIELYSWYDMNWNGATARTWDWKPTTARLYSSTEVSKWGIPNDFKLRTVASWGGGVYVAVIGNAGLITIVDYATGNKKWAAIAGSSSVDNIHGIELLPTGNVAVAASTGGYVRVYASSGGATTYASYTLTDAHQVLWDPAYNVLWAVGTNKLVALTVGTASAPSLTATATYTLPSDNWCHSVATKYGSNDTLFIASSNNVWTFDKKSHKFTIAPGLINRNGVKAISNQPDGTVVLTRPDIYKTPVPSEPSTVNTDWTTSYVDYYTPDGVYIRSGHKTGAAYYRGFVYNTNYQ